MSFVQYEQVEDEYLERRKLRPSAGWKLLWAMGVGAVISGDFAGWNAGLPSSGFWGFILATFLVAAMYVAMVFTILLGVLPGLWSALLNSGLTQVAMK